MSLKGIAEETLAIIERGHYVGPGGVRVELAEEFRAAIEGTRLYTPEQAKTLELGAPGRPRFEVTDETSQVAARRLTRGGLDVAVLNFASARNPGGGFMGGAKAQEEDLARCSGLVPCLRTQWTYYEANRRTESLLYTDHIIYSPAVPFFRVQSRALIDVPFLASVITAPAPNAGEVLRRDPEAGPAIEATYRRRAGQVLAVARAHGVRDLVLGAWGCGVFRNDPVMAADAFGCWLERAGADFDRVVFAVYERGGLRPRFDAFAARFGQTPGSAG